MDEERTPQTSLATHLSSQKSGNPLVFVPQCGMSVPVSQWFLFRMDLTLARNGDVGKESGANCLSFVLHNRLRFYGW